MPGRLADADNGRTDKVSSIGATPVNRGISPILSSGNKLLSVRKLVPLEQMLPADAHVSVDELMSLLSRQDDERLLTIHELLLDVAGNDESQSLLYREGLIRAAEALLTSASGPAHASANTGLAPWQLKRSITLMQQRCPARVEVEELADVVGISVGHFSRAFKASMGLSPYRWQLEVRVKHAQTLLLKRHLAVEEIADTVGFVDSAHFTRVFKKIVGVTPGSWRKNAAAQN